MAKIDPVYGFDSVLSGFDLATVPAKDLEAAIEIMEAGNQPALRELAAKAVATLRVRTVTRAEQQDDLTLTLAVYAADMADYPPDVVVDACKAWARMEKWFPAWAELKDMLDRRVKRRRLMLDALRVQRERQNDDQEAMQ